MADGEVIWSDGDQAKLDEALRQCQTKSFTSAKEKWGTISSLVPGKTAKDCAARFRSIRIALAATAAATTAPADEKLEPEKVEMVKPTVIQPTTHRIPAPPSLTSTDQSKPAAATAGVNLWQLPASVPAPKVPITKPIDESISQPKNSEATKPATTKPKISVVKKSSNSRGWWKESIAIDLLTQRPIKELEFPPFRWDLKQKSGHQQSLFDGEVLACFMVSTGQLEHPVQRVALTTSDAKSLDSYLLQHFLTRAQVAEALELQSKARKAISQPTSAQHLSDILQNIKAMEEKATTNLQDIAEGLPGLTPLLERALLTNVGYGWQQIGNQISDRLIEIQQRIMQSREMTQNAPSVVQDSDNSSLDAVKVLQDRLQTHKVVGNTKTWGRGASSAVPKVGRNISTRNSNTPVIHKAAQKNSKTNAPNFLLATAPHMSARVRIASGDTWGGTSAAANTTPAWGGVAAKPGQTKSLKKAAKFGTTPQAGTQWGPASATTSEATRTTKSKKKKKKSKKELQGFAMKMG